MKKIQASLVEKDPVAYAVLSFPYDETLLNFVRGFEKRSFNGEKKIWIVEMTPKNISIIQKNTQYFDESFLKVFNEYQEKFAKKIEASQSFIPSPDFEIPPGLNGTLREYQKAGVEFVVKFAKNRAYIGDEMGLGKTITAIATIHYNRTHSDKPYKVLVVAPASLLLNWKRELAKWLPNLKTNALTSGKQKIDVNADVNIVSYGLLNKVVEQMKNENITFTQLIVDEAHYVKNKKAQRTKYVKFIAEKAPHLLFLSGTPITKKPIDLFAQLEIIGVAGDRTKPFGDYYYFAVRYCGGQQGRFGFEANGATNINELNQKLRSTIYLRRDKEQVLQELPDKQRQYIYIEIPDETKKELKEIELEKRRKEEKERRRMEEEGDLE